MNLNQGCAVMILFFDLSQTGSNIFDTPGGTVQNVIRPESMEPMDTDSYNCTAPPSVAGYPPTVLPFATDLCEPATVLIPMADYTAPHAPIDGDPFELLFNRIRLFESGNDFNPTNNSTHLSIAGKGVLIVNTTTGVINFLPDIGFNSGVVEVEYRISNKRAGDPINDPSARTMITIQINGPDCGSTPSFLITNPMIRSRVKRFN